MSLWHVVAELVDSATALAVVALEFYNARNERGPRKGGRDSNNRDR